MRNASPAERAVALILVVFLIAPALWFLAAESGPEAPASAADIATPPAVSVEPKPPEATVHRLQRGETVWALASAWARGPAGRAACLAALAAANPAYDLNGRGARRLQIGAELRVPADCRSGNQD